MRYGLSLASIRDFADPRAVVRAAVVAEEAGWEAFFVWDHLRWAATGEASADPWVALGACAQATSRIELGVAVTPLPRRRPQMVAQQLASLSQLSSGRVIFGAGIGGKPDEFTRFGDPGDDRTRAAMLDEGLELVAALLAGGRVDHRGEHYRAEGVTLAPAPARRIPVWIGGNSRPALRRAARWDGWLANGSDQERNVLSPADVAEAIAPVRVGDVAFIGFSGQADLAAYAAAGVTWWIENVSDRRGGVDGALAYLAGGPPGETLLT